MQTSNEILFSRQAIVSALKLKELLHTNTAEHVPIAKLARKVGLNYRTLQDCFKHLYGKSIFVYGQELRLQRSKDFLKDPDLTLQEIAEKCGYKEQSNFGAAFKKKFGIGPGEWRKEETGW